MSSGQAVAFFPGRGLELISPPDVGEPQKDEALVETELVGFCGTDREIVQGGVAVPPEEGWLILGHEMVGSISELSAPVDGLAPGDRVVPMVRLPCSSCDPCRQGRSDFCLTGNYLEFGITRLHGFARPSVIIPTSALVKVPDELGDLAVLGEPLSVVEKAVDQARHVLARIPGRRLDGIRWGEGMRALVTGAGSIGLLTVYLLRELGFEVEALDLRPPDSLSAQIVTAAGASYSQSEPVESSESFIEQVEPADLVIEATGSSPLAFALLNALTPGGALIWVGVGAEEQIVKLEATRTVLSAVLKHNAVIGTVNSSRPNYEQALRDLEGLSKRPRFSDILTSVLPVDQFEQAIWPKTDAIKQAIRYAEVH